MCCCMYNFLFVVRFCGLLCDFHFGLCKLIGLVCFLGRYRLVCLALCFYLCLYMLVFLFQTNSGSTVKRYKLNNKGHRLPFLMRSRQFSLLQSIQASSGTHTASYPMGKQRHSPGGEVAMQFKINQLPLCNFEVIKNCKYTSKPPNAKIA